MDIFDELFKEGAVSSGMGALFLSIDINVVAIAKKGKTQPHCKTARRVFTARLSTRPWDDVIIEKATVLSFLKSVT